MASWRPVFGQIIRLDTSLATVEQIEDFFAARKVLARGSSVSEDTYRVELAVYGRRKRVAIFNDAEGAVPGMPLSDLVEAMDGALRKLQIDIGGVIAWGDIDLGEVDVEGDDLGEVEEAAADEGTRAGAEVMAADADETTGFAAEDGDSADEGEPLQYGAGPILVVSDVPLADMPGLAAETKKTFAVHRMGTITALMGEADGEEDKDIDLKSSFSVLLSTDPASIDVPLLSVRSHGWRLNWTWDDELAPLPWIASVEEASAWVSEELGSGAIANRIGRRVPDADVEAIKEALVGDPDGAPRKIIEALGLPAEVADFLEGLIEPQAVPGVVVFEPRPLGQRLQTSVAYELVGEGNSKTGLWQAYRKAFVDRPRLTEIVASVQAGVGVAMLVAGVRSHKRLGRKIAAVAGGALIANAGTRIATTMWLQAVLEAEGLSSSAELGSSAALAANEN